MQSATTTFLLIYVILQVNTKFLLSNRPNILYVFENYLLSFYYCGVTVVIFDIFAQIFLLVGPLRGGRGETPWTTKN